MFGTARRQMAPRHMCRETRRVFGNYVSEILATVPNRQALSTAVHGIASEQSSKLTKVNVSFSLKWPVIDRLIEKNKRCGIALFAILIIAFMVVCFFMFNVDF